MDPLSPVSFRWNYCGICGERLAIGFDGEKERPFCKSCRRHYYYNPVPACCIVLPDADNRLLFVRRAVEPCLGEWTLPGGFMEFDESGEACALRELAEETSLCGQHAGLLGTVTTGTRAGGAVLVLGYLVSSWRGEIRANSDVQDARFFHREERPLVPFLAHRHFLHLYDGM